jgi:hypothetical protein
MGCEILTVILLRNCTAGTAGLFKRPLLAIWAVMGFSSAHTYGDPKNTVVLVPNRRLMSKWPEECFVGFIIFVYVGRSGPCVKVLPPSICRLPVPFLAAIQLPDTASSFCRLKRAGDYWVRRMSYQ